MDKHERIQKLIVLKEDWTVENGLLAPTLNIKRDPIENRFSELLQQRYELDDAVIFE